MAIYSNLKRVLNAPSAQTLMRIPAHQWIILMPAFLFALFQFFLQLSSSIIVEDLMTSFSINAFGAGVLASAYYYIYTLLQTPAGILLDTYGPRLLLSLGALVCTLGCLLFAYSDLYLTAFLGRLMMGGGCTFAFIGNLYLIREWFPAKRFAFMIGITETIGMLGTMLASLFLAKFVSSAGWRSSMIWAAVVAYILFVSCWVLIRDNPARIKTRAKEEEVSFWDRLRVTLRDPLVWLAGLYCGLMFSIFGVFVALWGVPFIIAETQVSLVIATASVNMVFIGIAIGAPLVGYLDQVTRQRRSLLIVLTSLALIVMSAILYIPNLPILGLAILLLFLGIFSSGYVLSFAVAEQAAPAYAKNTYLGFTNALCVASAPLLQPVVSYILHKSAELPGGLAHEIYNLSDYRYALSVLPVLLAVAIIIACFLPKRIVSRQAIASVPNTADATIKPT